MNKKHSPTEPVTSGEKGLKETSIKSDCTKSREQRFNERYANEEKKRIENKEFMIMGEEFAYEKGISDEKARWKKKIGKIIDKYSKLDSCPYCSAIMKQSHYCDSCQQRVSVPTDLLTLTEELQKELLGDAE